MEMKDYVNWGNGWKEDDWLDHTRVTLSSWNQSQVNGSYFKVAFRLYLVPSSWVQSANEEGVFLHKGQSAQFWIFIMLSHNQWNELHLNHRIHKLRYACICSRDKCIAKNHGVPLNIAQSVGGSQRWGSGVGLPPSIWATVQRDGTRRCNHSDQQPAPRDQRAWHQSA
jgi:hypothetical protein